MNTSVTVKSTKDIEPYKVECVGTDLRGVDWSFTISWGGYYSARMVSSMVTDLATGKQPFLSCRYNDARDRYVVVDDYGNEVPLSRFGDWTELD